MRAVQLALLAAFPLIGSLAGCAPPALTERPSGWPEVWKGRRLYSTPNAYIYASSPELAGQMDRLAAEVARDFQRESHRTGPRGLLIASDVRDEIVCSDVEQLTKAQKRQKQARKPGRQPTDKELLKKRRRQAANKEDTEADPRDVLGLTPLPLEPAAIEPQLGLPADVARQARWAVLLPSDALIRSTLNRKISAAMQKSEMNPVARVAAAPLILAVQIRTVEIMANVRPVIMFHELASLQADWSEQEISRISQAYAEGKLRSAAKGLVDLAEPTAKSRPAPVTSRPATQPEDSPDAGCE